MSKKLTIEYIKRCFEIEGYTLLEDTYISAKTKLKYKCPKGHLYKTSWMDWNRGHRCAVCSGNAKFSYKVIKQLFNAEGYTLLSGTYVNNSTKLRYICDNGHAHSITLRDWNRGHRCPYCNGRPIITIDVIAASMYAEGYYLISEEYINNKLPLECRCPEGHIFKTNWAKWSSHGYRCPYCYGNAKKTIEYIREVFEYNNYKLITDYYEGCNQKLHLICPNGHDYHVTWDNWNHNGSRCPKCNVVGTSIQENSIVEFLKTVYKNDIVTNSYDIIPPKELDIVLPDINLAIEYCGIYWHSELAGKDRLYHLNKLNECNKKGLNLLTIFEDELIFKKDILESVLKNKAGVSKNKIYARKCHVKEITTLQAREFCEQNHLQGYTGSSIKLGLFYDEALVSVMTFSKQSIAKGQKHKANYWELARFCNKINHQVVGGASKLLKYFERNYNWEKITSYADRRWSDGSMYYKLGFNFEKFTKPNYWYFKNSSIDRIHRFALRKRPDEPKDKTGWGLRQSQGYNRIWDCGNYRFVKYKEKEDTSL